MVVEAVELGRKQPPGQPAIGRDTDTAAVPVRLGAHPRTEREAPCCVGWKRVLLGHKMGVDVVGVFRGEVDGGSVVA